MYPYKNVIPTTYEQAINGNVVPSEELVDFDATPHAQSAKERIAELDVKIAELQKIVDQENAAKQKDIDMMQKDPRFAMSAIEYITRGDTSGFNNIAQSVQAKNEMDMNEKIQKALLQKQNEEKMDEYLTNRQKAFNYFNSANVALEEAMKTRDPNKIAMANLALDNAKADLQRWNKKIGRDPNFGMVPQKSEKSDDKKSSEQNSSEKKTLSVSIEDLRSKKSFKNKAEKEATINQIEADPAFGTSEALEKEYNRLLDIVDDETAKATINARNDKWQKEYDSLGPNQQRVWKRKYPERVKALGLDKPKN